MSSAMQAITGSDAELGPSAPTPMPDCAFGRWRRCWPVVSPALTIHQPRLVNACYSLGRAGIPAFAMAGTSIVRRAGVLQRWPNRPLRVPPTRRRRAPSRSPAIRRQASARYRGGLRVKAVARCCLASSRPSRRAGVSFPIRHRAKGAKTCSRACDRRRSPDRFVPASAISVPVSGVKPFARRLAPDLRGAGTRLLESAASPAHHRSESPEPGPRSCRPYGQRSKASGRVAASKEEEKERRSDGTAAQPPTDEEWSAFSLGDPA